MIGWTVAGVQIQIQCLRRLWVSPPAILDKEAAGGGAILSRPQINQPSLVTRPLAGEPVTRGSRPHTAQHRTIRLAAPRQAHRAAGVRQLVHRAEGVGHTIAVSRGTGLDLVNFDGSNHRQNVITFPAIITYSEYTFKPRPQWSPDGSFFTVAIPSKDPMAADASVAFYRVGADGTVTPHGTHPGNYVFGGSIPPQIAPDGGHVVYAQANPSGGEEALHMLTLKSDALDDNTFDHKSAGGWGWAPDSQH
jgi:hypothetical protein